MPKKDHLTAVKDKTKKYSTTVKELREYAEETNNKSILIILEDLSIDRPNIVWDLCDKGLSTIALATRITIETSGKLK